MRHYKLRSMLIATCLHNSILQLPRLSPIANRLHKQRTFVSSIRDGKTTDNDEKWYDGWQWVCRCYMSRDVVTLCNDPGQRPQLAMILICCPVVHSCSKPSEFELVQTFGEVRLPLNKALETAAGLHWVSKSRLQEACALDAVGR
jgi:hypothetical protein